MSWTTTQPKRHLFLNQHVSHHPENNASLQIGNHIFGVFGVDGTVVRSFDLSYSCGSCALVISQLVIAPRVGGGRAMRWGGRSWREHTAIEGEGRWGDYNIQVRVGTSKTYGYACEKKQLRTTTHRSALRLTTSLFCVLKHMHACAAAVVHPYLQQYVCVYMSARAQQHTYVNNTPGLTNRLYCMRVCTYLVLFGQAGGSTGLCADDDGVEKETLGR